MNEDDKSGDELENNVISLTEDTKENKTLYDKLKPNQRKKLDIFFEADPELLKYYNQTEIKYPEPPGKP